MARGTQASPLQLPKAPPQYDRADQDKTRRMIELILAQMGLSIQFLNGTVAGDLDFIPVSPVQGTVNATGDATRPPFIQLVNPKNSNTILVVYELRAMQDSALTPANVRFRITGAPRTFDTVQATSTLSHLNEYDTTTVVGTLQGGLSGGAFTDAAAQLAMPIRNIAGYGSKYEARPLLEYGQMPAILTPGTAIELTDARVATDGYMQVYAVWDEIAIGRTIGSDPAVKLPLPQSAVIGGFQTGEGVVSTSGQMMLIQLYNPGPNLLRVLQLGVAASQNNPTAIRRTAEPTLVSTWSAQSIAMRLDRRSTQPVTGILRYTTQGGTTLFTDQFWREEKVGSTEPALPFSGRPARIFDFPILVKPGSAIEIATVAASSAQNGAPLTCYFIWDEIANG